MKKNYNPVRGMQDITPNLAAIKYQATCKIVNEYSSRGYLLIETPAMEHIENLTNNNGGENEKLIFKIMKRGEKLNEALSQINIDENDLADSGLRYDLTVPLSRYYANNHSTLPSIFKSLQIGSVWRADRPQKGRYRQFTQCDIDVLGDASIGAEIDLLIATASCLKSLGLSEFVIHINDRRILESFLTDIGFQVQNLPDLLIHIDKLDKVGVEEVIAGVKEIEDIGNGMILLKNFLSNPLSINQFVPNNAIASDCMQNLKFIMNSVNSFGGGGFSIKYNPVLTRGMSYYTGPIFEITYGEYGYSIAGGGRYDGLVSLGSDRPIPACGFSFGFERVLQILQDKSESIVNEERVAILYSDLSELEFAYRVLGNMRNRFSVASIYKIAKNHRQQIQELKSLGYFLALYAKDPERIVNLS